MTSPTSTAPVERLPSCSLAEPGLIESRFGLLGCEIDGHARYCSARTGTWGSEVAGVEQVGALAVLVDHVLGEVGNHPQPAGHLPLTTQVSLDVLVPPPWRGGLLVATAHRVLDGMPAGYCRAEVTDGDGVPVACGSAWTASVPAGGFPPLAAGGRAAPPVDRAFSPPGRPGVLEMLGGRLTVDGDRAVLDGLSVRRWSNQHGALHGGVWACAAEIVAARLLGGGAHPLTTSHLDISFVRGGRDGTARLEGRLVHRGRTLGLAEVSGFDGSGRLCVHATIGARR